MQSFVLNFKEYFKENKFDIAAVLLITAVFAFAISHLWGYFGAIEYDNGREAYLPQLILEGKILYKDIFGMYNPLSYQINALLYSLFGNNLNVLYFAGAANALIILLVSYFILRQFISRKISVLTVLFLMFHVILNSATCTNYIFPYAYAMVYAVSFFLISVLFGIFYIKNPKKTYNIILSFLMLGISAANKPEFILCLLPLFLVLLQQKQKLKIYLISALAFILPSLISYGILFIQGFTWHDLLNYIEFVKNFFNTPEQQFYNKVAIPLINIKTCLAVLTDFVIFCFIAFVPILFFKLMKIKNYCKYFSVLLCILLLCLYNKLTIPAIYSSDYLYLSWVCLVNVIILYFSVKKKNELLIFLSLCAISSCYRLNLILKCGYCIYMCILPFLVCAVYFIKYLNLRFIKDCEKTTAFVFLLIFGFFVYSGNVYLKHTNYVQVSTYGKGKFYNPERVTEPLKNTTGWILENTKPNNTILVLPEGLFINYFTGRPTNPKYYHLIPNHISALGEDRIVRDLQKNLPDYFILNNTSYGMLYGENFICKDFGYGICDLINKNYDLTQQYQKDYDNGKKYYQILIYKINKKSK